MLPRSSTMANLPHKMPRMALFAYAICLLSLIPIIEGADPTFRLIVCQNTTMSNGLSSFTGSRCIPEVSPEVCSDCINYASSDAINGLCPGSMEVNIIYDDCQVTVSRGSTATIGEADKNSPQIPRVDPNFLYVDCPNATLSTTSTYTANSTYHTNLKSVLSNLSSNANSPNGFYNFSAGSSPPDVAYGNFICRGDLSTDGCRDCVTYAVGDVVKQCPRSKQVIIWYDECILRYSNVSIFSVEDTSFRLMLINPQNATNATSFNEALAKVMDDVANRASRADSGKRKFATRTLNYSALQTVYGLAQCTPDLSQFDCYSCLRTGISVLPSCCDAKIGARVFFPSCYVHYETYPFFNAGFGAPNYLNVACPNATLSTTSTYTANSTYHTNLKSVLSNLSSNANSSNGFYNFSAGSSPPDVAYGNFICRGDLSTDVCRECVTYAVRDVVERCPRSKQVIIWYDECILRYSNVSIFSVEDTSFSLMLINPGNATNATSFRDTLGKVMDDVSNQASRADLGKKKFATGILNYTLLRTLHGLAQCTPDLSQFDCYLCLRNGISIFPSCCDAKIGARVLFPSCHVRYETYQFYSTSSSAAPPPALRDSPPSSSTTSSPAGKAGVSWQVVIAIVVPTVVFISVAIFYFMTRRAKKNYKYTKDAKGGDDISTLQSLHYDLRTIQAATKNFSEDNKIGEGGFGLVYKGSLPDGQDVAVKRLSRMSSQGVQELKNEVVLLAKLQHRNLVKLLGFCFEGEEKLLIFEFVPNKSLDSFLFDQQEQFLDWARRYKIIGGIARGMSYLHEDSQFRIIHRDLKASNILLDGDMNAKISDFGMAQILRGDQTQGNASEIVGTLGYMSPEYAMHGRFSTESDVFSFGVVVLEIITGMKSNNFSQSDIAKDLLSYAWKFWNDGAPLHLMDPTQKGSYSKDAVIKCIHIALLCVQDDPSARPSMATVVAMLDGYFATLSLPQQPAYYGWSRTGLELGRPSDKLLDCSMNEVSISELEPR